MATYEACRGLTLPEALLELVGHHGNARTRHMSQHEVKLLAVAAEAGLGVQDIRGLVAA